MAISVDVEAVSVRSPSNPSGRPSDSRSQRTTTPSSSVPMGEVRHSMGFWPRAAVIISPRIPGPDADVEKYAKNPGCCQCVALGRTSRCTSARIASTGSGSSGACAAKLGAMDPGSMAGNTAYDSTPSR